VTRRDTPGILRSLGTKCDTRKNKGKLPGLNMLDLSKINGRDRRSSGSEKVPLQFSNRGSPIRLVRTVCASYLFYL